MQSRKWFLLVLVPLAAGVWYVVHSVLQMRDDIVAMARVHVPGEGKVELDTGDWVVFGESVGGALSVSCSVTDDAGTSVALRQPSGHTTYSGFGHAGESMFELTTAHRGTYQVACTGTGSGELAFGRGIGKSIVRILIGVFGTLFAVGVTAVAVFLLRRRRRPL